MPRSRSGSRPSSRPASRPVSMVSTALTLAPITIDLGEELIKKITGFGPEERNFEICRDFFVSNLLYHNCLEPHERDINKRLQGIAEKWLINADRPRSDKLLYLLNNFNKSAVFEATHEQHDIRVRLLSLLLHLSNSYRCTQEDDDEDEISMWPFREVVENLEEEKRKKREQVLKLLAQGEKSWSPPGTSDLSDWSDPDDDRKSPSDLRTQRKVKAAPKDIFLPGCKKPLRPPVSVTSIPREKIGTSVVEAENWLRDNVLKNYWIKEADGANKFPLKIESKNSAAYLMKKVEHMQHQKGIPVDVTLKVSEYQILRECLWMLRNPLCTSSPIFQFETSSEKFVTSYSVRIPSLTSSLSNFLEKICILLNDLHRLESFISYVFDRRRDETSEKVRNIDGKTGLPPLTYEAYADALTQILHVFSADLLTLETTCFQRKQTFTLLDFDESLLLWQEIIRRLSQFHSLYSDENLLKNTKNWQKAMILISGLHEVLTKVYKPNQYAIFVDIFIKTITPYLRIISVWITQGRLEDWRNEFVFAINPKQHNRSVKRKLNDDEATNLEETFWNDGFIAYPYTETLRDFNLKVPDLFVRTLTRIFTCGKSIEILTRVQKEGILNPTAIGAQSLSPSDQFYQDFLNNLKSNLVLKGEKPAPTVSDDCNGTGQQPEGSILANYVQHVEDIDSVLVAAFETLLKDEVTNLELEEADDIVDVKEDFMVLNEYILDPMMPISDKLEDALAPVVHEHTQHACSRLVSLFRKTLDLEQHLRTLRSVFLLEAGDLLQEFCVDMFTRFESMRRDSLLSNKPALSQRRSDYSLDSLMLTLFLHDCLGRRLSCNEFIYRFKVDMNDEILDELQTKNQLYQIIDSLSLKYVVDWPLNIVIHQAGLQKYNKIFIFLVKVKQVIWNLQRLQAKDLIESVEKCKKFLSDPNQDDSSDDEEFDKDELSEDVKLHRVLLLRSWLMHFMGTIHSYFMTRVVHSTELELRSELGRCTDLDAIINAHDRYIERIFDRCFLHPTASVLKEALVTIMRICSELCDDCTEFMSHHLDSSDSEDEVRPSRKQLRRTLISTRKIIKLEEGYSQNHQFLASTLNAKIRMRNVPYLEGLVAALTHSCPSVAIIS